MDEAELYIADSEDVNSLELNFLNTELQLDHIPLAIQQKKSRRSKKITRTPSRYGLASSSNGIIIDDDVPSRSPDLSQKTQISRQWQSAMW